MPDSTEGSANGADRVTHPTVHKDGGRAGQAEPVAPGATNLAGGREPLAPLAPASGGGVRGGGGGGANPLTPNPSPPRGEGGKTAARKPCRARLRVAPTNRFGLATGWSFG